MNIVDAYNFKIIAVTDKENCEQDFTDRMVMLADSGADAVILRAKELSPIEYYRMASVAATVFDDRVRPCLILHSHMGASDETGIDCIHMPLPLLESLSYREQDRLSSFRRVGVSIHSPAEAVRAVSMGADFLVFGHVFDTNCKPGLPPRGIAELKVVVNTVSIPVYAIGGINTSNIRQIMEAGAKGACLMSSYMQCDDAAALTTNLREALQT